MMEKSTIKNVVLYSGIARKRVYLYDTIFGTNVYVLKTDYDNAKSDEYASLMVNNVMLFVEYDNHLFHTTIIKNIDRLKFLLNEHGVEYIISTYKKDCENKLSESKQVSNGMVQYFSQTK